MAKCIGQAPGDWSYKGDSLKRHELQLEELIKKSDSLPAGEIVGAVYFYPVADGRAYYLVTKDRPLTIAHIPCGDAWQLPEIHIRGLMKKDILEHLRREKAMKKLFGVKQII